MYMNCNYIRYIERRLKPQVISQFKFVFRQEEIHTGGREAMEPERTCCMAVNQRTAASVGQVCPSSTGSGPDKCSHC